MNVYDAVRTKRAIRDFSDQPISNESMTAILNAGRWSGSSKNFQPWHFIVLRQRERLVALSECGQCAGHLAGATVGVALVTGDWMERWPVAFDLGRAAQNMMLVAHEMGIGSVMANIYDIDRANVLLELPARPHVLLGYFVRLSRRCCRPDPSAPCWASGRWRISCIGSGGDEGQALQHRRLDCAGIAGAA